MHLKIRTKGGLNRYQVALSELFVSHKQGTNKEANAAVHCKYRMRIRMLLEPRSLREEPEAVSCQLIVPANSGGQGKRSG